MLLDLIEPANQEMFNIKLAHTIGLNAAVYCGELLNIIGQVTRKKKFDENGFFKLNRDYVFQRTTLTVEEQLNIDSALSKINLIKKDLENPDNIKLDITLLGDIIANEDLTISDDLKKRTKLKNSKEAREAKKASITQALKKSITITDKELNTALCGWIDSMAAAKKLITKECVVEFQKTMNNYTKGDLDLALRLVQIATINLYRDCAWAINIYEKDMKKVAKAGYNIIINRVKEENISSGDLNTEIVY